MQGYAMRAILWGPARLYYIKAYKALHSNVRLCKAMWGYTMKGLL